MLSLIWISEISVQMKDLLLTKYVENSTGREQYVLAPPVLDLFDMFWWMVRVRMCLHMLVFVCLWFSFCKREVI